jgi:hypothetical protein
MSRSRASKHLQGEMVALEFLGEYSIGYIADKQRDITYGDSYKYSVHWFNGGYQESSFQLIYRPDDIRRMKEIYKGYLKKCKTKNTM